MTILEKINKKPKGFENFDYSYGNLVFPRLEGELGPKMMLNGVEMLVWSLNNYLGLANHPEIRAADEEATKKYGLAYPMGARIMSGNSKEHDAFESELASFIKKEKVMLVNFGYQAVVSVIESLVDRHDVIVYDSESHACIVDGVRLHLGHRFAFKHNDPLDCEKQLERAKKIADKNNSAILVITEGVFGMSGSEGKIKEICKLKNKFNFTLLVDDAHGFGTMGKTGAGTGEEQGVQDEIDIYFSTFAKSMAGIGAFFGAKKEIIKYLKYNTRSQIFAKSLPIAFVIGLRKRLELLKNKPELKIKMWENTKALQKGLVNLGYNIGNTTTPVTPFLLKEGSDSFGIARLMEILRNEHRIFCSGVTYPVVPKGVMMIRLIPTAAHTIEQVNYTVQKFGEIKKQYNS